MMVRVLSFTAYGLLVLSALISLGMCSSPPTTTIENHRVDGWKPFDAQFQQPPARPRMLLTPWCPIAPLRNPERIDHT